MAVETSMEGLDRDLRLSYSLEMAQKPFEDGNTNLITSHHQRLWLLTVR